MQQGGAAEEGAHFCLTDFQWLGFDLGAARAGSLRGCSLTVIRRPHAYQIQPAGSLPADIRVPLGVRCVFLFVSDPPLRYLVVHKQYYPAHLRELKFNHKFLQKGLLIDKELGNVCPRASFYVLAAPDPSARRC